MGCCQSNPQGDHKDQPAQAELIIDEGPERYSELQNSQHNEEPSAEKKKVDFESGIPQSDSARNSFVNSNAASPKHEEAHLSSTQELNHLVSATGAPEISERSEPKPAEQAEHKEDAVSEASVEKEEDLKKTVVAAASHNTKEDEFEATKNAVDMWWEDWYVKGLMDFIRIPNLTPMVDETYQTNGLLEKAMECVDGYINELEISNLERKVFKPEGSNPLIVYKYETEDMDEDTPNIMIYGHLDKQPYEEAWDEGLSPTDPVIKEGRLYGRGAGDDGYSSFSAMLAIKAAQMRGAPLPRICLVLETEEESGSENLMPLLAAAESYIGKPDALFCLDSGVMDYEQLWTTSTLRGCCLVDLKVECAQGGYHSGEVGGIVPETFRVVRSLLDRVDDPSTGRVTFKLQTEIPAWKVKEAEEVAASQGELLFKKFELLEGVEYMN